MHLLDLDFAHLKSLSRILCKPPKYFPVSEHVSNPQISCYTRKGNVEVFIVFAILSRVRFKSRDLILIAVFVALSSMAQMSVPGLLSIMIDNGVTKGDEEMLTLFAGGMIALAALGTALNIASTRLAARLTTNFSAELRSIIFRKVEGFSLPEIDKFSAASLITRNTSDVTNIQNFLSLQFRLGIFAPMMAAAGIILSIVTAGQVAIVLVVAIPVLVIALGIVIFIAAAYSVKLRQKIDEINRLFLETLDGVRVIRAFNRQDFEMRRFNQVNTDSAAVSRKSNTASGSLFPLVNMLFGLTTVAVMAVGSKFVVNGEIEIGVLIAATQYITMILVSIMLEAFVVSLFPDAYACMKRIGEVIETDCSIKEAARKEEPKLPNLHGTVEFRNVTFAYPGAEEPVVKGINFCSKPGETTAIIGRTGCGKSSVVKLIPRLYDTLFGEVLVDGVNVREYSLEKLREKIGYVPQKNVLFSGDIASNLNFGKEGGSEKDWQEAAEFVEKKEGAYHAAVSQGGTNFSGGQRQRMAIARAVMKQPEIYVFDDSFSALDVKTDKELRGNLRENMKNATMIVVAQRVSSIIDATRIIVLDHGETVGMGTHQELLMSCGLYREIAEIQLGKEAVAREIASM